MRDTLVFNPAKPTIFHIDINSCFATIEQQANPHLRGKPVAVAAYTSSRGVILAASVEAKKIGIKTGLTVGDAQKIYPRLVVLEPDTNKYRHVHRALKTLFSSYTNTLVPKSIDEFILDMADYIQATGMPVEEIAREIKKRITEEVGDWITVSIGIGTSRFMAKTASNYQKPDGLIVIDHTNYLDIYASLELTDLHGINIQNKARLNKVGIYTVLDFYNADSVWLKAAFASIGSYYWFVRLRGWDIDTIEFERKSFGNQYATKIDGSFEFLLPLVQKLVEKTASRMRAKGYCARGVYIGLSFQDGSHWHISETVSQDLFDARDIYREVMRLLSKCPEVRPVRVISESVFNLTSDTTLQLNLFSDFTKKRKLVRSIDDINERWGAFSITAARALPAYNKIPDRISFGGVQELD